MKTTHAICAAMLAAAGAALPTGPAPAQAEPARQPPAGAENESGGSLNAGQRHWLAERAETSDLVVIARLERVKYRYRNEFPIEGEAWFRPLITYKSPPRSGGLIIVGEKGLHENECYFPRTNPWDEKPRYLLFLNRDPDTDSVRGHPEGCAIEILVTDRNRYAARWPQPAFGGEHGRGDPALAELAREMDFQGPMSRIDAGDMLAHQRRDRAERDFMRLDGTDLIPTRGIELTELRRLMQPGLETDQPDARERKRVEKLRREMFGDGES
ncbi:MAG: hypothetical protein RQ847_07280 [Wenzhouxiangellaceae bacterium]|nr:hypothetical protein [Wenzhouxiangellaceae bacterium]